MNTRRLALLPFVASLALPAAATDYYWSSTAANPGNWNDVSNWKTGGDSQWDPDATALPVPGTDTVTFRPGDHVVTTPTGTTVEFGVVNIGNYGGDTALTFDAPGATFRASTAAFAESKGASVTVAGGTLDFVDANNNNHEFYTHGPFTVDGAAVRGLRMLCYWADPVAFTNGATGSDLHVSMAPFDNTPNCSLVVADPGTSLDDLRVSGCWYDSQIVVRDGARVGALSIVRANDKTPAQDAFSSRIAVEDASVGTISFTAEGRLPHGTDIEFLDGATAAFDTWDGLWFGMGGTVRASGAGTSLTNLTARLNGAETALEIDGGAAVQSRRFVIGRGASGLSGTVSGADTVWTIAPNDMQLEGALVVGENGDGVPGAGNTLVVEDGAFLNMVTNNSFKNGALETRLTGLLVGAEPGDDGNLAVVRSGAVVSNAFWTGVGGTFNSSEANGGDGNTLRIEGATYVCGTAASEWDSTLFLGGMQGGSNTVEVLDGSYAWFGGQVQLARGEASGGNVLRVRNSTLEVGNRICLSPSTLAKGRSVLEIGGTNGVVRTGGLVRENFTAGTSDPLVLRFLVDKAGRSTDEPFLTISSKFENFENIFQTGGAVLDLRIPGAWAHGGKENVVTLVSNPVHWGNTGIGENAMKALAATASAESLGPCELFVEYDQVSSWVLRLRAGQPVGTILYIR